MRQVKLRYVREGLAPRRTKMEIPGWAGDRSPRANGSHEQVWHCTPFSEGAQYGIEIFYPFDFELRVTMRDGKLAIEGDYGEPPAEGVEWPPFRDFGTALALPIALLLVLGGLRAARAVARFGDPARIHALTTADPAKRRAWKGVLLVLAVALAFLAAARPQYGKGTRLIPATNIDVVLALDYSKSMFARDVEPSRIFRRRR